MKILLPFFALPIISTALSAQEISYPHKSEKKSSFELLIEDITALKGEIRIAVFNSEQNYNQKEDPVHAVALPVNGSSLTWKNAELPYGEYAIAVYHDENKNGALDKNLLGVPKEAYGFSNNARGKFGPASWNDARFEISSEISGMSIQIK